MADEYQASPGPSGNEIPVETPSPALGMLSFLMEERREPREDEKPFLKEIGRAGGWRMLSPEKDRLFPREEWPRFLAWRKWIVDPKARDERRLVLHGQKALKHEPQRHIVRDALQLAWLWEAYCKKREGGMPDFGGTWNHSDENSYIPRDPIQHLSLLNQCLDVHHNPSRDDEKDPNQDGEEGREQELKPYTVATDEDRAEAGELAHLLVEIGRDVAMMILHGEAEALRKLADVVAGEASKAETKLYSTHIGLPVPPVATKISGEKEKTLKGGVKRALLLALDEFIREHGRLPSQEAELWEYAEQKLDRENIKASEKRKQIESLRLDMLWEKQSSERK